jgi:CPA1 family monovalent cation:H+ antiporter
LNGLVFVLIGLQLPFVMAGIRDHNLRTLVVYGVSFSGLLILLRLLWMFPGAYLANLIRRRILRQKEPAPSARNIFVVGWTGMRGVVSLAAAIALPQVVSDGSPFPQRNMIIFLAFSVILVTLVVQGLTLPSLIRALGVAGTSEEHGEEREARRTILQSALDHLQQSRDKAGAASAELYDDLAQHYRSRLRTLEQNGDTDNEAAGADFYSRYLELSQELVQVERQMAIELRNHGRIGDDLLRQIEHELDLSEARLKNK